VAKKEEIDHGPRCNEMKAVMHVTSANDADVAHHFDQLVVANLAPRVLYLILLLQMGIRLLQRQLLVDPFFARRCHCFAALFLFGHTREK